MTVVSLLALCPVLIAVAFKDLAQLRIPNGLILVALAIFAISATMLPSEEVMQRGIAAAIAFGLLLPLFAARLIGGGDTKMLPVLVLFVPPGHWQYFGAILALSLLVGVIAIGTARAVAAQFGPTGLLALDRRGTFPMGVSIALSGLALAGALLVQS